MVLTIYHYMFACYVCTAKYLFTLLVMYIGQLFGCCLTLLQENKVTISTTANVLETEKKKFYS